MAVKKAKTDPAHDATERLLAEMEQKIAKEYAQAEREVQGKIDDYFQRFELKDQRWREWVADGTKTKEEYQRWRVGQMAVGQRWESLRNTIAEDFHNTNNVARSIVQGYMPEVYAENFNYGTYEAEIGAKVDTSFTLYDKQTVERLMRDDPKLLPDPGKKKRAEIAAGQDVLWNKQQVQSVMMQGILQGESIPKLANRLAREVGEKDHKAAIRNARTMTTGAQNAGRVDSYKRAEDMGIKMVQEWRATLDMRTRHSHRQLDGERQPVGERFSNGCEYPGDPSGDPAEIYNCRCTLRAVVAGLEPQARKYRDDSMIEGMTYEEWKESKVEKPEPITLQEEKGEAIAEKFRREYRKSIYRDKDDVTKEYIVNATPRIGSVTKEENYISKNHDEEIAMADWIHDTLGGDLVLLRERSVPEVQKGYGNPDYQWNGKLWDLKTISSNNPNTFDQHLRHANNQIAQNRGGVFVDVTNGKLDLDEAVEIVRNKAYDRMGATTDILVRKGDRYKVIRIRRE